MWIKKGFVAAVADVCFVTVCLIGCGGRVEEAVLDNDEAATDDPVSNDTRDTTKGATGSEVEAPFCSETITQIDVPEGDCFAINGRLYVSGLREPSCLSLTCSEMGTTGEEESWRSNLGGTFYVHHDPECGAFEYEVYERPSHGRCQ